MRIFDRHPYHLLYWENPPPPPAFSYIHSEHMMLEIGGAHLKPSVTFSIIVFKNVDRHFAEKKFSFKILETIHTVIVLGE